VPSPHPLELVGVGPSAQRDAQGATNKTLEASDVPAADGPIFSLSLFANLRCGVWYCPPVLFSPSPQTCYFKSSDGHYGQWAMGSTRLNLNVLDAVLNSITARKVVAIVDATQHGKQFPDALSKTIPMWAATLNDLLGGADGGGLGRDWKELRRMFPSWVTDSEVSAIGDLLPTFSAAMSRHLQQAYGAEKPRCLPRLSRRLQCVWFSAADVEASWLAADVERCGQSWGEAIASVLSQGRLPVALVCASGDCKGQSSVQEQIGGRCGWWTYIPGAGDDHDGWGRGLTSDVFWRHCDELLQEGLEDDEVQAAVDDLVRCAAAGSESLAVQPLQEAVRLTETLALRVMPETLHSTPEDVEWKGRLQDVLPALALCEQRSGSTWPDVAEVAGTSGRAFVVGVDTVSTNFGLERALPSILGLCAQMRGNAAEGSAVTIVGPARLVGSVAAALLVTAGDDACDKRAVRAALAVVSRLLGEGTVPRALAKQLNRFLMPRPVSGEQRSGGNL
jgi:tRNA A64-2'-O-ribosylphosphate transferase